MARRARSIQMTVLPAQLDPGEAVERFARATEILTKIAARIDEEMKQDKSHCDQYQESLLLSQFISVGDT